MDRARFFVRGLQKARLQEPRDPGSSLQAEGSERSVPDDPMGDELEEVAEEAM